MAFLTVKRALGGAVIIPVVVTILCLIPFVDKAFHIDDPVFIWSAKHIQSRPFDFYGFKANWYGTELGMWEMHHNPPGACYYMALAGFLFGWSEVALHIAFLVPAVVAALGTYYLARALNLRPEPAALAAVAAVLTPAFLVSSTNVMCDTMTLAFWVWAVALWVRGIKENKQLSLLLAAVLVSVCTLTRYVGIALVALLFVYALMQKRKLGVWVLFLLIPAAVLATYLWATQALYGRGLLSEAASFAIGFGRKEKAALFSKGLTGLAFAGGCIVPVLFYCPLLWSRRVLVGGAVLTILLIFALTFAEHIGTFPIHNGDSVRWGFLVQLGLMVAAGVSLLVLAVTDFLEGRDADSLLLLLWVLGIFVFASFINWVVNARSILPMVPAAAVLLVRRIERRGRGAAKQRAGTWRTAWPLVPAAVVALSVCWADYAWAGTAHIAAGELHKRFKDQPANVWFQGHWGFQYYMEDNGHKALDYKHSKPSRGDIVILPSKNSNLRLLPKDSKRFRLILTLEIVPCRWLATMDHSLGAGFYASIWGPLPFAIGPVGPDKYHAFIVKQEQVD